MTRSPQEDHVRVVGLVPAGGESRRMGSNKLALPWRDSVVLEQVVRTLRPAVDRLVVVLGPRSADLAARLSGEAEVVVLADQTQEMRETIERGLLAIADEQDSLAGVLLALADQPHVPASIIQQLVEEFRRSPASIVMPVLSSRKGHPIVLPISVLRELPSRPKGEGLDRLLRDQPERLRLIDVPSPSVLEDIDLPADYERLKPSE